MTILHKLSITEFINKLISYHARDFEAFLKLNKINIHDILFESNAEKLKSMILALENVEMNLVKVKMLDYEILKLKKSGILKIDDIFEFSKIIKTFLHFKERKDFKNDFLIEYFETINISPEIIKIADLFDNNGAIKSGIDENLDELKKAFNLKMAQKKNVMINALNNHNLQEYLIDKELHLVNDNLTLLLRPGFLKVLKAKVISRSSNGFFYAIPLRAIEIDYELDSIEESMQLQLHKIAKIYSKILQNEFLFVKFINKEFDFLDRAISRIKFAKDYNYEFIFAHHKNTFVIKDFSHPALKEPCPVSVDFNKALLLITGVNAGGKTMLLKSILSCAFFAKYFIPCKINANNSHIPYIKNIDAILNDPQDSKNDISTFSGRIKEFSQILKKRDLIIGVDEIEIGTDANEAAILYKILLEELMQNNAKIIVTTHHKYLANLMSSNDKVQLLAAMYDYKNNKPSFNFMQGIGKSYALECAQNFGISKTLIDKARELLGKDANNLENLIEKSNYFLTQNMQKELLLQEKMKQCDERLAQIDEMKNKIQKKFESRSVELSRDYNKAIKELKMLAKTSTNDFSKQVHKTLNKNNVNMIDSNLHLDDISQNMQINQTNGMDFKVNDYVIYDNFRAQICDINNKNISVILENGLKISKVDVKKLKKSNIKLQNASKKITLQASPVAKDRLDLHGFTKEEALEELEDFLQNAIMAKFSQVVISHGLGSGILKRAVVEFLENINYIQGFCDAPAKLGGVGAKIVYL